MFKILLIIIFTTISTYFNQELYLPIELLGDLKPITISLYIGSPNPQLVKPVLDFKTKYLTLYSKDCYTCPQSKLNFDRYLSSTFIANQQEYRANGHFGLFAEDLFYFNYTNAKSKIISSSNPYKLNLVLFLSQITGYNNYVPYYGMFGLRDSVFKDFSLLQSLEKNKLINGTDVKIELNKNKMGMLIITNLQNELENSNITNKYRYCDEINYIYDIECKIHGFYFNNNQSSLITPDINITFMFDIYMSTISESYLSYIIANNYINLIESEHCKYFRNWVFGLLSFKCQKNLFDIQKEIKPLTIIINDFEIRFQGIDELFDYNAEDEEYVFIFHGSTPSDGTIQGNKLGTNFIERVNLAFNQKENKFGFYGSNVKDYNNQEKTSKADFVFPDYGIVLIIIGTVIIIVTTMYLIKRKEDKNNDKRQRKLSNTSEEARN